MGKGIESLSQTMILYSQYLSHPYNKYCATQCRVDPARAMMQ